MVGRDTVAFAAISARMLIRRILRITNCRFVFARFHHKDFLHFAVIKVVQIANSCFGANNELDKNIGLTSSGNELMLQQSSRGGSFVG